MKILILDFLLCILYFLNRRKKLLIRNYKTKKTFIERFIDVFCNQFLGFGLVLVCATLMTFINIEESNFFLEVITTLISYIGYLIFALIILQQIKETIDYNKLRAERANVKHHVKKS